MIVITNNCEVYSTLISIFLTGPTSARGEPSSLHPELALQDHGRGDVRHFRKVWSNQTDKSVSYSSQPRLQIQSMCSRHSSNTMIYFLGVSV
jgi:hypothetical protein